MESIRKPFQGVQNIIRFNWHFYVVALVVLILGFGLNLFLLNDFQCIINSILLLIGISVLFSLLVSWYIYDCSDLYEFKWMSEFENANQILNIHAGFDETSEIIEQKFKNAELAIFDFYDEQKHTEISIKRARKLFPDSEKTIQVVTNQFPVENEKFDLILNIFSAHEIRNMDERVQFFKEQNRVLKPNGKIIVTEHLRDFPNFLAYTIGFFHFHSKNTWKKTFEGSGFQIEKEIKKTAFISTFILTKNGISS
jgi:SAM-dependent methyltransferase